MIHYQVSMDNLTEIEAALGMMKDKSTMVLRTAINNSAKQIENRMVKGAKTRYRYHNGTLADFRTANTIKKATARNLTATIQAKGKINEMLDFQVDPSTYFPGSVGAPSWIRARVRRDSKFQRIALRPNATGDKYKAFVVKYHSGHLALAQRVPGSGMRSKPSKEAIKSLLSISAPKMEEMAYKEDVDVDVNDILAQNIQTQIARYLG